MKRKLLLMLFITLCLCLMLAVAASATTYYVDKNGNLVDSTSENIAYEYDRSNNNIANIYLHDLTVTKIIIPDMSDYAGTLQLQSGYEATLGVYTIGDKETKANSLIAQITEIEVHENIYLDGAYSAGAFNGYTALETISFYGTVGVASKGGFFYNCSKLTELHFYGQNLAIPSKMISTMPQSNPVKIVFHENATGTLSTGGDTLPTYGTLGGWQIIINPNIKPSNASDTRLGAKWGQITATTGWELIMAVNPSLYNDEELEALKTSHTFCSRAGDASNATVMQATVMSYCDAIYNGEHNEPSDDGNCETSIDCTRCSKVLTEAKAHNISTVITYVNGFDKDGEKLCECTNDGCTVSDTKTTAPSFFECLGYSVPEYDRYAGLSIAFKVSNLSAYIDYVSTMGEFKYGIAIANATGSGELVALDGEDCKFVADKGLIAEMTGSEYTVFKLSVVGFDSSIADSLSLVIAAYASADYDADGANELKFVQHSLKNESNDVTANGFNTVTLNKAYYNLYPEKKEENA